MSDTCDPVRIGIVSISDRASSGVYEDKGLPALKAWLGLALKNPITFEERLIPDEQATISDTLIQLVDAGCALVLTTGGTGPAPRDVTPEATLAVAHKEMPGFGEMFRVLSFDEIGTSTLQSRAFAGLANATFVFCLPGSTSACRTAWEKLIRAQLDSRTRPCNLATLRPRLRET